MRVSFLCSSIDTVGNRTLEAISFRLHASGTVIELVSRRQRQQLHNGRSTGNVSR